MRRFTRTVHGLYTSAKGFRSIVKIPTSAIEVTGRSVVGHMIEGKMTDTFEEDICLTDLTDLQILYIKLASLIDTGLALQPPQLLPDYIGCHIALSKCIPVSTWPLGTFMVFEGGVRLSVIGFTKPQYEWGLEVFDALYPEIQSQSLREQFAEAYWWMADRGTRCAKLEVIRNHEGLIHQGEHVEITIPDVRTFLIPKQPAPRR